MFRLFLVAIRLLPTLIWDYFTWILPWSKKVDKIPLEKRYKKVQKLVKKANKLLKIETTVIDKENIPNQTVCFVANHEGAADPLPYFDIFDRPTAFIGKIEIEKIPFVGRVLKIGGGLFLNRDDLKQQLKTMMKVQDQLKNGYCNWFIFPEGTRNKDHMAKLLNFHHGTFRAPIKAKVPIVPVVNRGSFRLLSFKYNYKKYPTIIKFLKPIYPSEYQNMSTEEIALEVSRRIQKELNFIIKRLDHEKMSELKSKKYRFNRIY